MKVLIYHPEGMKNPSFIQIETRTYNRYILLGINSIPKLSDMKVYKDNIPLDKKIKMKQGTKWLFGEGLRKKVQRDLELYDSYIETKNKF